jgi:hypothetical protein
MHPTPLRARLWFPRSGPAHVHLARNESPSTPVTVVQIYLKVPPGGSQRIDEPAPANCPFWHNDRRRPAGAASAGLSGRFLTVPFLTGVCRTARVLTLRSRPIVSWAATTDRSWRLIICIAAPAASVGRGSLAWVSLNALSLGRSRPFGSPQRPI